MHALRAYKTYCAVTAHFTAPSYNYIERKGVTRQGQEQYNKRKDKHFFRQIADKYKTQEYCAFFVANFAQRPRWIGELAMDNSSHDIYMEWTAKMQNLSVHVETEIKNLRRFVDAKELQKEDLFKYNGTKLPIIFRLTTQNIISKETYLAMNRVLKFVPYFDKVCANDIIYQQHAQILKDYDVFLTFNNEHIKQALQTNFK